MILDDTVKVKLNGQNRAYWKGKGYVLAQRKDAKGRIREFIRGDVLEVRVSELPPKSNVTIRARCVVCSAERKLAYCNYSPTCWQCNLSKQKGMQHPRYLHRVKTGGADRAFDLYLRRKFNITADTYFQMLKAQNHKCAICETAQAVEGRRFCVDHDHKTGKVRGVLCQPCNTALGLFKDDLQVMLRAKAYLEGANSG